MRRKYFTLEGDFEVRFPNYDCANLGVVCCQGLVFFQTWQWQGKFCLHCFVSSGMPLLKKLSLLLVAQVLQHELLFSACPCPSKWFALIPALRLCLNWISPYLQQKYSRFPLSRVKSEPDCGRVKTGPGMQHLTPFTCVLPSHCNNLIWALDNPGLLPSHSNWLVCYPA